MFSTILALSSAAAVFLMALLAYQDGMLFPSQMVARYPIGFPFIANGGMWGDLFFVTPALYLIGKHHEEWGVWLWPALVLGVLASYAMHHFVYLRGALPDSLAGGGRPISPAGWVHVGYFAVCIALVGLFYLRSTPTTEDVTWVGILLGLHVVVANHVPFHYINRHYKFPWCTIIFENEPAALWTLGVALAMLVTATVMKLPRL